MSKYLVDQIRSTPNIAVRQRTTITAVHGSANLEAVTVTNEDTGVAETRPAAGLFIFVGAQPRTGWLAGLVELDEFGYILTGPDLVRSGKRPRGWTLERDPYWLESSVPGIFVAGDVRARSVKRVASAVGEGAMAIQFVHQYLASL
jgi:thioredoxin reductase (NADPH)